jgi:pyruvate formate lyase activating enzyme
VETCGADAWAVFGSTMTAGEVMQEVLRDAPFYEESGGGVTFSGGEPLLQPGFLAALLAASKMAGLHTAVDTCGAADWAVFERVLPLTDLFLYDLKVMEDGRHREEVGATNRLILDNLQRLSRQGAELLVRLPVVPGITDDEDNVARWGAFIAGLHRMPKVQLLPYHRTGEAKYSLLGMDGERRPIGTPAMERLEEIAGVLTTFGLDAVIGAQWR